MLDMKISLTRAILLSIIQKLIKYFSNKFSNNGSRVKFYKLSIKKFETVTHNAGINLKKINDSGCLESINNFLFQSISKGYPFSNKDIALILAKENSWGLSSKEIIQLATTFCKTLLHSIERDYDYDFSDMCIIFNLKESKFIEKLNDLFRLNTEYYKKF